MRKKELKLWSKRHGNIVQILDENSTRYHFVHAWAGNLQRYNFDKKLLKKPAISKLVSYSIRWCRSLNIFIYHIVASVVAMITSDSPGDHFSK